MKRTIASASAAALGIGVLTIATGGSANAAEAYRAWDFESSAQVADFRADQRGTFSASTDGFSGSTAIRLTNDGTSNETIAVTNDVDEAGAVAGEVYRVTARLRTDRPNLSAGLMIREVINGAYTTTKKAEVGAWLTDTDWHTVVIEYTATTDQADIDYNFLAWQSTPGQSLYVDDVGFWRLGGGESSPPVVEPEPEPEPEPDPGPGVGEQCGAQGPLAPSCGALWGTYTLQRGDATTAVTNLEKEIGRQFDISLRYHDFSDTYPGRFPDSHEQALGESRTLFLSWQSRVSDGNRSLAWKDVAAGKYDQDFVATAAQRVKAYGKKMIIAFDPEFDSDGNNRGTMAEYVAAYRHVHDVFEREGATNVVWAWVSTGYLGAGNDKRILAGYPGDQYVDWVGYDPYNLYKCNGAGWKDFESTIKGGYNWLVEQGFGDKPIVLSEYGTQYDSANPARSREWATTIGNTLQKYPNIKALIRFDANGVFRSTSCDLFIDNGPGMLDAFKKAGQHPYLNTR